MTNVDGVPFLGRATERLERLIHDQTAAVFARWGIEVPVRSCSLVLTLERLGAASASDLARELGVSHQLVLQKVPKLERLGLVASERDPADARRKFFRLTDAGLAQAKKVAATGTAFAAAYGGLFEEVGDVHKLVTDAAAALTERPLVERMPEELEGLAASRRADADPTARLPRGETLP